MLRYILFLIALGAHVDRLQALLGAQWPDVKVQLDRFMQELVSERDDRFLPARVHRIYRSFFRTPAEPLVRALFQQAGDQTKKAVADIRSMVVTDPTTRENRSVDLPSTGILCDTQDGGLIARVGDLRAAADEFARALAPSLEETEQKSVVPESRVQAKEKHINVWISERLKEPERPLTIGARYTLNLAVGKEMVESLVRGKAAAVSAEDLRGGGLQTEWIVSTLTFELASDDQAVALATHEPNVWSARFSLWIPEHGESDVRHLFIVPQPCERPHLEVVIYAVRGECRELYRQFTIKVPVDSVETAGVVTTGTAVEDEWVFAPSRQMNLGSTHEWTTPPGRLTLTVFPGVLKAHVTADLPGRQFSDFADWFGQQAIIAGSIDNVRGAAERFRGKWQQYLNDIDAQELTQRLDRFIPTYDWAAWVNRSDLQHAEHWIEASQSVELRELAIYGHELYQEAFPPNSQLRAWMDSLPLGTRVDITWMADAPGAGSVPNVPWGLMYQANPPAAGDGIDPVGFLALRFRLGYWGYRGISDGSKALGTMAKAHQAYCLYWGNHPSDETGNESSWQRDQFQGWQNRIFVPRSKGEPNPRAQLLQALTAPESSPTTVIYFFCQAAVAEGNKPVLRFGSTSGPEDVLQTTDLLIGKPLPDQPLVFANACTTSAADPYIANLLQQSLFRRGCRGFLGTETKVPIQFASRFAKIFFSFFYRNIDPAPMAAGEALAQTRLFLLTEYANIGGIFYAYLNQYELYMADDAEVRSLRVG